MLLLLLLRRSFSGSSEKGDTSCLKMLKHELLEPEMFAKRRSEELASEEKVRKTASLRAGQLELLNR